MPRAAKFLFMYKRPGQRVLINSDGDMIVRPAILPLHRHDQHAPQGSRTAPQVAAPVQAAAARALPAVSFLADWLSSSASGHTGTRSIPYTMLDSVLIFQCLT